VQPPAPRPSAAEILAASRAAARAKAAQQKAERLKKQRRAARRQRAAARRAAEARDTAAAGRLADARRTLESTKTAGDGGVAGNDSMREAVPVVAAATIVALLMLGLGLVPEYVVSRNRITGVLERHRGDFNLVGGTALFAAAVYTVLTFLS
jgi:hypothetical protein